MITDKIKDWADEDKSNSISFGKFSVLLKGNGWKNLGAEGFHSYCEEGDNIIIYDNDSKDIILSINIKNYNGKPELILKEEEKNKLKQRMVSGNTGVTSIVFEGER